MPIRYAEGDEPRAVFEGRCTAEEADDFLAWARRTDEPSADLRSCTDVHTALIQILLCARMRVTQLPQDPLLAGLLAGQAVEVVS